MTKAQVYRDAAMLVVSGASWGCCDAIDDVVGYETEAINHFRIDSKHYFTMTFKPEPKHGTQLMPAYWMGPDFTPEDMLARSLALLFMECIAKDEGL